MQAIDEFGPNEHTLDESDAFRGHGMSNTTSGMDTLLSGITDTHLLDGPRQSTDRSNTIVMDAPLNDEFGGGAGLLTDLPYLDIPFPEIPSALPPMLEPELMDISDTNVPVPQEITEKGVTDPITDTPMQEAPPLPEITVPGVAQNGETILENGHPSGK